MPIEFARVQFVSRGKGHSVVAAAAYRAGAKILDERIGQVHDYEKKQGVLYNEVLLPKGVNSKLKQPEMLWNLVEETENRKNAQLAREVVLALPSDEVVSDEDRIELCKRFVEKHFIDKGLAAQISIHAPHTNSKNIHAHILITTRRLLGNSFEKKKARDLLPEVRNGRVIKEDKIIKDYWREAQNHYFKEKGLNLEVDPVGLISEIHLGKEAFRGKTAQNEKIITNKKRIEIVKDWLKNDTKQFLKALTQNESVFSENDIYKLVHRYTDSREAFDKAVSKIFDSKSLIHLGEKENSHNVYTTKALFRLETKIEKRANQLKNLKTFKVGQRFSQRVLNKMGLDDWQKKAVSHIVHGPNVSVLVGKAGAGKSYTMKAVHKIYHKCGYEVLGLSFSKKAANNLQDESGIQSRTIHSFLYALNNKKIEVNDKSVVVLDEAGMVDAKLFNKVLRAVKKGKGKLILVGDQKQLQPIGPGAPFRAIAESIGRTELSFIKRQEVLWQRHASMELSQLKTKKAVQRYINKDKLEFTANNGQAFEQIASRYTSEVTEGINSVILAAKNQEVDLINQAVRAKLKNKGTLSKDFLYETHLGEKAFAKGDKILFLKNDYKLGVSNGESATVLSAGPNQLTVKPTNKGENLSLNPERYKHLSHGYAMTIHKSQGSTFDKVHAFVGGWGFNKQTAYVAFTRHKKDLNIYTSQECFDSEHKLLYALNRDGMKDSVLDFPLEFAKRRGLQMESLKKAFKTKAQQKLLVLYQSAKQKAHQIGLFPELKPEAVYEFVQKGAKRREVYLVDDLPLAKAIAKTSDLPTVIYTKDGKVPTGCYLETFRAKSDVKLINLNEGSANWQKEALRATKEMARHVYVKNISKENSANLEALKHELRCAKVLKQQREMKAELTH